VKHSEFFVLAFAAFALLTTGCSSKKSSEQGPGAASPTATVDSATAGSISGTVRLDGKPPVLRPINMSAEPFCEKAHPTPVVSPEVVLGPGGTLANVVVYLKGDDLSKKYRFPLPAQPVLLDQRGCMYEPHVVALRTGQQLEVRTEDQTTHNVHALPSNNPEWNESQPPGAAPIEKSFPNPELAIPVRCNVHPWMKAYIFIFSTPYYAVTAKDGKFEIANLPPGTYTVEAWQERYGTRDQTVTLGPKQSTNISFTFNSSADSDE
jgi:plastocyanin